MVQKRKTSQEPSSQTPVSLKRPKTCSQKTTSRPEVSTAPGKNSRLQTLPDELWSSIFSRLSFFRDDIASCRLVCRQFKRLSSEYLITYAVVANRLPAYKKLDELIAHPIFSKHVTELLIDDSYYQQDLSQSPDAYIEACTMAYRRFRNVNHSWEREEDENEAIFQSLENSMFSHGATSKSSLERITMRRARGEDQAYADSWTTYRTTRAWSEAANLSHFPEKAIKYALTKLPALRHISLTDFRSLCKHGESYNDLCGRLFREVLEPACLHGDSTMRHSFSVVFEALAKIPQARIHTLAIGRQPFFDIGEMSDGTDLPLEASHQKIFLDAGSIRGGTVQDTQRKYGIVLANLQRLDLAIEFPHGPKDAIRNFLSCCVNVSRLSLHVPDAAIQDDLGLLGLVDDVVDPTTACFEYLVSPHCFPKLKSLELSGFVIPAIQLVAFLRKHRTTMQDVRLLDNFICDEFCDEYDQDTSDQLHQIYRECSNTPVVGTSSSPHQLHFGPWNAAQWCSENLHLNGIQVRNVNDGTYMDLLTGPLQGDRSGSALDGREYDYLRQPVVHSDVLPEHKHLYETVESVEQGRKKMESLWLNGRPNMLTREYDCSNSAPIRFQDDSDWYMEPRYWD